MKNFILGSQTNLYYQLILEYVLYILFYYCIKIILKRICIN
jgi:hypothetical protein